jgi:2-haloacid dehalogenase
MDSRPPIRAVVFDVGGVLLGWDPRRLYRQLLPDEAAVEAFLGGVCPPEFNEELDRGRDWDEAIAARVAAFPHQADLVRAYRDRWGEMLTGPVAGTVRILERLHGAGMPLYALTNFSLRTWTLVRRDYAFFDRFLGIVVSGAEGVVKPDPAIYGILEARYGLEPAAILFIDDVEANVAAARARGWRALRFTSPEALEAELGRLDL